MRLSPRTIDKNIRSVFAQASSEERDNGLWWYRDAKAEASALAKEFDISINKAVGVIAAISPGLSWDLNISQAKTLISAYCASDWQGDWPRVGVYGKRNVEKAIRILSGEDPLLVLRADSGPKTRAFYLCILNPDCNESVCVDRHAKCLAINRKQARETVSGVQRHEYRKLANRYRELAKELNLLPNQLQAITWLTWRRIVATN